MDFKLEGNKRKITNITTKPLVRPKRTPKNLSKPEAPDYFMSLLINVIKIPPRNIKIIKTTMYEIIFDTSSLPIYSLIFGVAKNSRLIAATNAASHRNNDKNSLAKPLDKDITPEAIKITKIDQSVKFNPKASNELFLH